VQWHPMLLLLLLNGDSACNISTPKDTCGLLLLLLVLWDRCAKVLGWLGSSGLERVVLLRDVKASGFGLCLSRRLGILEFTLALEVHGVHEEAGGDEDHEH